MQDINIALSIHPSSIHGQVSNNNNNNKNAERGKGKVLKHWGGFITPDLHCFDSSTALCSATLKKKKKQPPASVWLFSSDVKKKHSLLSVTLWKAWWGNLQISLSYFIYFILRCYRTMLKQNVGFYTITVTYIFIYISIFSSFPRTQGLHKMSCCSYCYCRFPHAIPHIFFQPPVISCPYFST